MSSSSGPIIGVTAAPTTHVPVILGFARPLQAIDVSYLDAVSRAGGVPVVLPPVAPEDAAAVVGRLDGLVLTGGGDVDPACYGEERHEETYGVDPARDAFEFAAVDAAIERRLPTLAICRGMQVLNVARGGSLIQHIEGEHGAVHRDVEGWDRPGHSIRFEPTSQVAEVLGTTELHVNSLHHQAVDRLGDGLTVVGRDEHGTVESLAVDDHPEVLSVQWHPELLAAHAPHSRLFSWLTAAAGDPRATVAG